METVHAIFSLPVDLKHDLNTYIDKRGMSKFVAEALRDALERKKQKLLKAYKEANDDEGQIESFEEWESTLADGFGLL